MSKIGIILDVHLCERSPRIRKDNFLDSALEKLGYVAKHNDYVVLAGDLFHYFANSTFFFNKVYNFFNSYKGKFIVIPGNHDLMYRNYNLDRTTLGSLFYTGVIDVKTTAFHIEDTLFGVSLVDKNTDSIPVDDGNEGILIGHNYYNWDLCPEESLTAEDIKKLNYKYVILGHDHCPYDDMFVGNSILFRVGSLTRLDSQYYNKDRKIFYLKYNTETREVEREEIPVKSGEEVFIDSAFASKVKKEEISFVQIAEVLEKLKCRNKGNLSLLEELKRRNTPQECIEDIKQKHEINGILFN